MSELIRSLLHPAKMATENTFRLTFLGDIMLGRLLDQLLPEHVDEPEERRHIEYFKNTNPQLHKFDHASPWGDTLELLTSSDLVLGNLETSATTHDKKWPNKVFNYRMHPANLECLKVAGIKYVSLANNHTLDFCQEGLYETIVALDEADVAHAGAGRDVKEAKKPAVLKLRSQLRLANPSSLHHELHVYSFSDHPSDWATVPEFNLLRYDIAYRQTLRDLLDSTRVNSSLGPALKIMSIHWGPNYSWQPAEEILSLAHFLVDECNVDIIHGHSSHHVQGVEVYKGKLIIYGCGDFVDDYAVVANFRNDLSAVWNVTLSDTADGRLEIAKLEVFPNRIKLFQAGLLERTDQDHLFVCDKIRELSADFGTKIQKNLGSAGQLVIDMAENSAQT